MGTAWQCKFDLNGSRSLDPVDKPAWHSLSFGESQQYCEGCYSLWTSTTAAVKNTQPSGKSNRCCRPINSKATAAAMCDCRMPGTSCFQFCYGPKFPSESSCRMLHELLHMSFWDRIPFGMSIVCRSSTHTSWCNHVRVQAFSDAKLSKLILCVAN